MTEPLKPGDTVTMVDYGGRGHQGVLVAKYGEAWAVKDSPLADPRLWHESLLRLVKP